MSEESLIEWRARAQAVSDEELAEFRRRICIAGGHIGTCAIGRCSRCGGFTSSSSMSLCKVCAEELGVCQFDQRMTGWGSVSAPDGEANAARWLALLMRGYSAEREAAKKALDTFPMAGLPLTVQYLERQPGTPVRSPATAEFNVGFDPIPDGLAEGAAFLNGFVMHVNAAVAFATIRTPDAATFEERAAAHPGVRYVELNSGARNPPWE